MHRASRLLPWLCVAVLPFAAHAAEADYRYDTVHSQVVFSIDHDGFSRPFGRLRVVRGWLRFDPAHWDTASTAMDIDTGSVDMGDPTWNAAVCKPALLDCARYSQAHFASTGVTRIDDRHGVLHGQLTLHGVTRPLDIRFTVNRTGATIFGMHEVAGFSGTTTLDRRDFGITGFDHSIGHDVSLWLEIEAIRQHGDERAAR